MRKVYVDVMTRLIIRANDNVDIEDVLSEMDYNFKDTTGKADIEDSTIEDWNIQDSK